MPCFGFAPIICQKSQRNFMAYKNDARSIIQVEEIFEVLDIFDYDIILA